MYYKNEYKNRFRILKGGLISLVVSSNLYGAPSGGTVVSGTATISQNANTTNINQSSNKAVINWQDFSIKSNETVNFNQPNVNSITLNRVIGNEKSIIDGALNANGQVWLINSNGVLFGKNAKVNTAGIVASTKDISNEDFNNGNYNFKGNSKASIVNEGEIKSLANTHATFIANSVTNKGKIEVHKGTINLVGASDVTLTLNENQNLSLKVNKGVLDALVDNQNLIVANGGQIYLTTNAKDELLKGVVNHSGIIEANSLDDLTNNQNEVILFAHGGTANISGEIKAKGGFVETSGKDLNVKNEAKITAKKWLLDPVNVTIDNQNGAIGSETVGASVIETSLNNNTNIEIQADNNINVNQNITWSTAQELTLNAGNNIYINKEITATNNAGKLALKYGQASLDGGTSDYYVNAKVNLKAGQNFSTQKGSDVANLKNYTVITDLGTQTSSNDGTLQGINGNLNGNYVLGSNIDAGVTKTDTAKWGAEGFNPIGDYSNNFNGTFDGLGHTISDLYINRNSTTYVGLFGYINNSSTVKNIGLTNVDITGNLYVGGLAGENNGLIQNSYASGTVEGNTQVGGLVGRNWRGGRVQNSYSTGTVEGNTQAGGLVGRSEGSTIENSYSNGSVNGNLHVGGLVGYQLNGTISNSYASGNVGGDSYVGGLVGYNDFGTISNSYASGSVTGYDEVGGLVGLNHGAISNSYSSGTVGGDSYVGGLVGLNYATIENSYATGSVNGHDLLGGLVGENHATIENSYATGSVNGHDLLGGLVGLNHGAISNSYSSGTVGGDSYVGGLVGLNYATIENSYSSGTVGGDSYVGGLVGLNYATIENSYATGSVNGDYIIGGLVGENHGAISNSYASGSVNGHDLLGGLVGINTGAISNSFYDKEANSLVSMIDSSLGETKAEILSAFSGKTDWGTTGGGDSASGYEILLLPYLIGVTKDEDKSKSILFSSGFGTSANPYTITNWTQLQNINNSNIVSSSSYYFNLLNNINSSTTGYMGNSGLGWNPIGDNTNRFTGTFDGLGFTISDLYINRPYQNYVGLFGYINSSSTVKNIGLTNVDITGQTIVGGLAGENYGTISNSYASGSVNGDYYVGGLVGLNNGTISNSYASVSAIGSQFVGGLVGFNNGTISNSFYDKTKYTGNGVGGDGSDQTGVTGLTTEEMSYGTTFKNASWGIVADSSINQATPVIKYDSVNNKYFWAISPIALTYTLSDKTTTYDGTTQTLSSFYTSNPFTIPTGYNFLNLTSTDYKFQKDGSDVTGYKDAGTYSNIKVALNGTSATDEFLTISSSGNTDGNLVINKANLDIVANSNSLVYNGQTQSVNGYSFGTNKLLGSDTEADLTLSGTTTTSSSKNVGTTKTNISGTSNNYNLTFNQGSLEITKANAIITANSDSKVYNGLVQNVNGFTVTGLVNNEDKSVLIGITGDTASGKDVGVYNTALAGTDTNYNLTFNQGSLEITKANAIITANSDSKVYNGLVQNVNGFTVTGLVNNEDKSVLIGITGDTASGKNAGTYNTNLSGTDTNYNLIFVNGKLTINKKDLTISNITANNKTYDGTTTATLSNIGTLDGLVTGENLVLNNPTSVIFSSKDVADGIVVTATGYTIADKDSFKASNYNLIDTSKTTTANIVASVNPTPTVDEKVQRVIASIEPSTNSNSSSNQSVPNSLNINIRTLSFNGVDEIRVINGGVRVPDDIVNSLDEL
ncbi:GLUG motif-containing protein [Aliarcobacter cryaerophilus]|uniref:GLUG motif-containing protein n=1 Tax=Aliarcobacter cryaerophilus TaxID=28198 RepID=UPI0021B37C3F|nr:GLUG motif-containing protein [Aliarcobacter cryaerophilus]MCT7468337.1 filamentous hemagglutinin N-terminal domain-containing protein [Aliarcobacter cryaerophilus]